MQKKLPSMVAALGAALLSLLVACPASAATTTFVTPVGSTTSGGPVNDSATFTTSAGQIGITLTNLQANILEVAQALSDLSFTYSGVNPSGATLASSSGQEITVNSNGTFSLGPTVSTGWALSSPASNTLLLGVLGTPIGPAHLIVGPPGAGNVYSNANGSIAGNPAHNPFLNQSATFTISLAGITAATLITGATFSFGTTAGITIAGVPTAVPLPSALYLFGTGLIGLGLIGRRRKKSGSAVLA